MDNTSGDAGCALKPKSYSGITMVWSERRGAAMQSSYSGTGASRWAYSTSMGLWRWGFRNWREGREGQKRGL